MTGIENFGAFLLTGILLNITPGSDTMYILARSISNGRSAGVLSALGISAGIIVHTLMATFGLSVILAQSATAFNAVKYAGAAYLVYLGVKALLQKRQQLGLEGFSEKADHKRIFLSGALTNILNPKVALFFLAFLPQFIHQDYIQQPLPYLLLGCTFIVTGTIWNLILALASAELSRVIKHNKGIEYWLNKSAGAVFILLGIKLALQRK